MKDSLVTIIGSSYFEPISTLLEKLNRNTKNSPNEVQASHLENGYAASICLLAVVCLESYVMRVRYVNNATQKEIDKASVPKYIKTLYSDFSYENELIEIHILRDLIAHNHLWEINFLWDQEVDMNLDSINRRSKGDKKYEQYVDTNNNTTKTLKLNVNPIKVCKDDAIIVLQTMWKTLLFLEDKNRNQCYVSHLSVRHEGKSQKFGEIVGLPDTHT